jgi:hypothetical protein
LGSILHPFEKIETGSVMANEVPTFRAEQMPYGGMKDSGTGRERLRYPIEEMTERKLLPLNLRQNSSLAEILAPADRPRENFFDFFPQQWLNPLLLFIIMSFRK